MMSIRFSSESYNLSLVGIIWYHVFIPQVSSVGQEIKQGSYLQVVIGPAEGHCLVNVHVYAARPVSGRFSSCFLLSGFSWATLTLSFLQLCPFLDQQVHSSSSPATYRNDECLVSE